MRDGRGHYDAAAPKARDEHYEVGPAAVHSPGFMEVNEGNSSDKFYHEE
jgi:hypothetical protein